MRSVGRTLTRSNDGDFNFDFDFSFLEISAAIADPICIALSPLIFALRCVILCRVLLENVGLVLIFKFILMSC